MRDFRNFFFISEHERLEREKNSSQTVFSLNYVDGILDGRYDLEDSKSARMYHLIVKLLKGYLPPDKDVLDYFLMFSEVSKRRYKGVTSNFIDEGIYWQLNEMHITGKLSRVIKDIDKLKKKLLKDTYWNDEMIKNDIATGFTRYVGAFDFQGGKLIAMVEKEDNARCIGDLLVANLDKKRGMVALNIETGAYEIQYIRELTSEEVNMIFSGFHIVDVAYRISVERYF